MHPVTFEEKKKPVKTYQLLRTSWKYQGKVFFEESTLHGVRYIAESGRPFFEKFLWFACVAVGAIASIVIIVSLWEKFQTNPTITGLDTDFHSWDVQFPAVTLCPVLPINQSSLSDYINSTINDMENADEIERFLINLTQLTYSTIEDFKDYTTTTLLPEDTDLKKLILDIVKTCDDLLTSCEFKADEYNCSDGFFPVFTENGFCYTFNSKHYEGSVTAGNVKIKYIKETDAKWSLKFSTNLPSPYHSSYDLAIYVHSSDDVPAYETQPQLLWDFRANRLLFSVKQTYTTEDVRQLTIKQRHCIFEDENKLKINDVYTYTSCAQQCRMDNALRLCGCVPHFHPQLSKYRHCKLKELGCIIDNIKVIKSVEKCKCQLGCSNTVYEVEKLNEGAEDSHSSDSLEIEFVSWPMVRYKREVLFGWVDLMVSFGGIAGLFLGFSLLSGVEIVYYFTIRACCMVYKEREELVKIRNEDSEKKSPDYDLSLVPYFLKEPKAGQGRRRMLKKYRKNINFPSKLGEINVKPANSKKPVILAPFGIEFTN